MKREGWSERSGGREGEAREVERAREGVPFMQLHRATTNCC